MVHSVQITVEQAIALLESVGMPALNLVARRRRDYRSDLKKLAAFLSQRGITGLDAVDWQALERYQAEMDKRGYEASTRNHKMVAIKSFFNYLHRHSELRDLAVDSSLAQSLVTQLIGKCDSERSRSTL